MLSLVLVNVDEGGSRFVRLKEQMSASIQIVSEKNVVTNPKETVDDDLHVLNRSEEKEHLVWSEGAQSLDDLVKVNELHLEKNIKPVEMDTEDANYLVITKEVVMRHGDHF